MLAGERRRDRRVATELPVQFELGAGRTRDLSANGVFFETPHPLSQEQTITFDLLLNEVAGPASLRAACRGRVVRVIPMGGTYGIAVTLDSFEI
jgi:hypothetical protein